MTTKRLSELPIVDTADYVVAVDNSATCLIPWALMVKNRAFFVDPDLGNDANLATLASPLKTVERAIANAHDNDTILIKYGTTSVENMLTITQTGLVILPYGDYTDGLPVITGLTSLLGTVGTWTEVDTSGNPLGGTNRWKRTGVAVYDHPSLFINSLRAASAASSIGGVNATGKWFQTGTSLYVWSSGGNPASTFTALQQATLQHVIIGGTDNVSITGIIFEGAWLGGGLQTNGANWRLTRVEVRLCGRTAFQLSGSNTRLTDCYAHDVGMGTGNGEHGFGLKANTTGTILTRCLATKCGEDGFQLLAIGTGESLDFVAEHTAIDCESWGNDENALDCKFGNITWQGGLIESDADVAITLHGRFRTLNIQDAVVSQRGSQSALHIQDGSYLDGTGSHVVSSRNLYYAAAAECVTLDSTGGIQDCTFASDLIWANTSSGNNGAVTIRRGTGHSFRQSTIQNIANGQAFRFRYSLTTLATLESCFLSVAGNTQVILSDNHDADFTRAHKNGLKKNTNTNIMVRMRDASQVNEDFNATQLTDGTAIAAHPNLGGTSYVSTTTAQLSTPAISAMTRSGRTVSCTSTGHQLVVNQKIIIRGTTETAYNRAFRVTTVADADHFTVTLPLGIAPSSPATGSPVFHDMRFISTALAGNLANGDEQDITLDNVGASFAIGPRPFGAYAAGRV